MIAQQTQNAFNDKFAQFLLVPLGGAIGFSAVGGMAVEDLAGLLIVLPFILFAPLAGWLSDRFSKRDVMIGSAVFQLVCMLWITGAVWLRNMPLALCGFFLIAAQSVFFSPAKMGLNKELLGERHIGFATGIQQMLALLGLLAGQILAGRIFDARLAGGSPWQAAFGPLWVASLFAIGALALAWIMPQVPAHGARPFSAKVLVRHVLDLREMWAFVGIRRASLAIAFFWGFAGFLNLWSVKFAKALTAGQGGFGSVSSLLMGAASVGMILGFAAAAVIQKKRVQPGIVPLAGLAMALLCLGAPLLPPTTAGEFLAFVSWSPAAISAAAVSSPAATALLVLTGALAFASALFLAPLNAWIQNAYPAEKRGEFQSSVNLQNCVAGMLAVAGIFGLGKFFTATGFTGTRGVVLMLVPLGIACLIASALVIKAMPAPFITMVVAPTMRWIYGLFPVNADRLPATGGVLLLPNHVTYIDAILIYSSCPRPVRFVMDEVFTQHKGIRLFTVLFDTVNIRRDKPLDAIREVIRSLEEGDVICLFPEGQLTRTGTLSELQKGFELIARKARSPMLPVWVDGSWGSVFSYERNRFFRKWPRYSARGVSVAFGAPLEPSETTVGPLRSAMQRASSEALASRFRSTIWKLKKPAGKNAAVAAFRQLREPARREVWRNGRQIGMVNAIPRGATIHCLVGDPVVAELPGLLATFPSLYDGKVVVDDWFKGDKPGIWVGGSMLRDAIQITQITRHVDFYDFDPASADAPLERADVCHYPCLVVGGRVIAMSMRHPAPSSAASASPQLGHLPHSWGRMLPGWHLVADGAGGFLIRGPAAATDLPAPPGLWIEDDFLMTAKARQFAKA